jgi:hypothetical protein
MKKLATELTEKEQLEFIEKFHYYTDVDGYDEDLEGHMSFPWSCPWFSNQELTGNTIEEMAKNYSDRVQGEIEKYIEEDREHKELYKD